jgi:hypothetical protein
LLLLLVGLQVKLASTPVVADQAVIEGQAVHCLQRQYVGLAQGARVPTPRILVVITCGGELATRSQVGTETVGGP